MTTLLSPMDLAPATQTGKRVFRKQILKKGSINYQGRRVVFDEPFLRDVVESFKEGAYDQVPFVFADPDNRHTMDPERFRGEVKGLELTNDGVDAIVEATPRGARVIRNNPRLGVSARIVQGLEKSDGRVFPRAIQHVLATMDPRLTGLKPWQTVDLSDEDDDEEVIDLTAATVKEGNKVGTKTRKTKAAPQVVQIDLSQLDDGDFKDLLLAASAQAESDADADTDTEEVTRTTRETVKRKTPKQRLPVDEPDDEEDEDLEEGEDLEEADELDEADEDLDESEEDDEDEDEDEDEEVTPVARKKKKSKGVKLSTPVAKRKVSKARRLELKLAATEWAGRKRELIQAGVPPFLLDLAEPVMSQPDKLIIDLSETGVRDVDAKVVIDKMLAGVEGMIDLTPEIGHGISSVPDDENDPTRRRLAEWEKEYGKP